ncbi:MAG: hypothetical protein R2865_05925 [Deinococcales bacterium]
MLDIHDDGNHDKGSHDDGSFAGGPATMMTATMMTATMMAATMLNGNHDKATMTMYTQLPLKNGGLSATQLLARSCQSKCLSRKGLG